MFDFNEKKINDNLLSQIRNKIIYTNVRGTPATICAVISC